MAYSLERLLARRRYEIEAAGRGIDGISSAGRRPPDVVVLDIGLPDLDGYEVARRLRATPAHLGIELGTDEKEGGGEV